MKFTIIDDLEDLDSLPGKKIPREVVSLMVKNHRKDDPNNEKLWYAHFSVKEILDLFADNRLIPKDVIDNIQDSIANYGFKIYLGKYGSGISAEPVLNATYKNCVTTILCNTEIVRENHYKDMLKPKIDKLLIAGLKYDEDDLPFLDQANICPPPFLGGLDEPKCDYDVFYDCVAE